MVFLHMLRVKNISFAYSTNEVLKDLSFEVDRGKTLAIIGESGFHEYERDIMAPHMDVYLFRFLEQEHYSLWENVSDAVDQLIDQKLISFDSASGALEVI